MLAAAVTALGLPSPAGAAQAPAIPPAAAQPASPTAPPAADPSAPDTDTTPDVPVSLDRIRRGLNQPVRPSLLKNLDRTADFKSEVRLQQRLDEILSKLDYRAGPVPAGGVYNYEQQRLLMNSVDHPLSQPYAAFNGSELITLALEGLLKSYLAGPVGHAISSEEKARKAAAARNDVAQAIADYCDAQPDHGASIAVCARGPAK